MKTPIKVIIFYISAILVVVSSALFITKWFVAPYLFAIGAAGVATYFLSTPYAGTNFRVRRLHRMEIIASVLMVVSSYLMFKNKTEWIMTLSISAFLILYSSIVAGIEEKKEKK